MHWRASAARAPPNARRVLRRRLGPEQWAAGAEATKTRPISVACGHALQYDLRLHVLLRCNMLHYATTLETCDGNSPIKWFLPTS